MKSLFYIVGAGLLATILIIAIIFANKPVNIKATEQPFARTTPTQIATRQPDNNTEKVPLSTTSTTPSNPILNEKFLIINQRDYYLSTLDGSDSTLLFSGKDSPIEMASLSPDKTQFAYFKDNFIYIKDTQTQETTTLNKEIIGSIGGNLRWSPDGKKLFMSCANAQQPSMAVCAIDTSNGQVAVPINEKNTDEICHININSIIINFQDLSSDGIKIAYSCSILTEQGQRTPFAVYIYDTLSKTSVKVLDSETQNIVWEFHTLSFSPDSRSILINGADQNYTLIIYLLDLKTGTLNQLTHDPVYHFQATAWGQDGKSFYVHRTSGNQPYVEENFLMGINGTIISPVEIQGIITR